MRKRILWNDIKGNRLLAVTTWLFMTVSAFLFALTSFLFFGLLGSVDTLMEKAQTPDFLQMHAGEINEKELVRFAGEHEEVRDYQLLSFLNLKNGSITLGGHSLADSTQDNGICVQSKRFDYLVDVKNCVIDDIQRGEIYVPVCYRQKYGLKEGEKVQIGENNFIIAGFLRDSQMNAMMASSKRFMVNQEDYDLLKRSGSEEYLIEFLLREGADVNVFAAKYTDAGLPSNGPAITKPLIRMMNALSDGLMILVILLVSVVLLLISMLCIRFTLLTQLEEDRREIGMQKAIGISKGDIRKLYNLKFLALSGLGTVCGLLSAFLSKEILSAPMQELYGASEDGWTGFLAAFAGVVLTEGILLLSVGRTLRRTEKLSAVEALNGPHGEQERKRRYFPSPQYRMIAFVIALGIFLMILPQNLLNTIASPQFVTYMGIGDGQIRLDIRQAEDIAGETMQVEKLLKEEGQAERFVSLRTFSCRAVLPDGSYTGLQVEQGDHTMFPVAYAKGGAPKEKHEIALSGLCADELGLSVGDSIVLLMNKASQEYTVCGIYSDITNGGKTAKAAYLPDDGPLMWSVFYVSLKDEVSKEQWLSEYAKNLSDRGISAKAADIQEYVTDTYGQTIREIRMAAGVAVLAAVLVMFVVVVLFTRLLVAKDRYDISLRKAIGFTGRDIRRLYILGYLPVLLIGILSGMLFGNLFGEKLAGMLLKTLGAAGFRFLIDYKAVCGWIPAVTVITVFCAVLLGMSEIKKIRAYECCMGKE
ncbi:MAG: FtsX-like permease family protein [Oscillospiraceae bacterium]|nr:FtsX-like permease family protein [Oscillospiraceae bacterium]